MKLPSSFTDYTRALLGVEEYEKLAAALEGEQPVSIRLNEDKLPESSFSLFRSSFRHVPWSTAGYYLDKRLTFTFDPLFHAGCYYVQNSFSTRSFISPFFINRRAMVRKPQTCVYSSSLAIQWKDLAGA